MWLHFFLHSSMTCSRLLPGSFPTKQVMLAFTSVSRSLSRVFLELMPRSFKISALDIPLIEASVNGSPCSALREEKPLLEVPALALTPAGLPPVK